MIETSFDLLRPSSAIFGNVRKMFGNIRLAFGAILENLRRSSESGRKSSENRHILYNKRKITWPHRDTKFIFSCSKYFTRSLCSLVKYFSTLEDKFLISARPCNILYIFTIPSTRDPSEK